MRQSIDAAERGRGGKTMTVIAIRPEESGAGEPQFRAIAGGRQSVGRTMGEALDALTAEWRDGFEETAVLIQRFRPDAYFTEAQYLRMRDLLARRSALTAEERAELEALIDTELDATVARTDALARLTEP
jgi:regulator of protease activity HflC (stomatin/prohibitin superfamily)